MGFCYQNNTKDLSAVKCGRKDFWREIRRSTTDWLIDSRRDVLKAVELKDAGAMERWAEHTDFRKFDLRSLRNLKTKTGKERWKKKSLDKKLLAWADELKRTLPVFAFCCYEFDLVEYKPKKGKKEVEKKMVNRRELKGCHLNGLVMLDIDHVDNPLEIWEALRKNKELMKRVVLVHITSSAKGIRIIFTADIETGNLADNAIVFAQELGYKADSSCIDATRNSFAPKESEILFIDEERLFNYYDEAYDQRYTQLYRKKETQPLYHKFDTDDAKGDKKSKQPQNISLTSNHLPLTSKITWHGHDIQKIIDAKYGDNLPGKDGKSRHNSSLELASDLLLMLEGNQEQVLQLLTKQSWVQEIIDERNENVEETVESAVAFNKKKEKETLKPQPSKSMQAAIKEVTGRSFYDWEYSTPSAVNDSQKRMEIWMTHWGEKIGELFDDYPMLKDVCKGLPVMQRPAAVYLAGGLMMTLMTRCWYRFYHKPEKKRRLNCSLLVIGDPASGKSVADDFYRLLAEPIKSADRIGKDSVNDWKETTEAKGANKDKAKKPRAQIRIHPARTSNQTFITDMVNTKEVIDGEEIQLHMLTFDSELDNTLTMQGGGSWINKQAMELKAFHNEEDGQAYSNKGSLQEDFDVTWNYIYTGTPLAMRSKVNDKNFGTGLPTRLTVIPMPATNFQMMPLEDIEHFDYERQSRMRQWAHLLDRTKGELTLWPLVKHLWEWTARRMEDAGEDDSKAEEMLCKRCAYHGLNYSAPYVIMRHWDQMHKDGEFWCGKVDVDEVDWKLCELLTNIHHACQKHYFLGMAEKYFDNQQMENASASSHHRLKTVEGFNRLPQEFTTEDVMKCFDSKFETARTKIKRLVSDHLVEKVSEFVENGTTKAKYRKIGAML